MSNFKMFNGTNWIDICDCDVHIKTSATWNLLDPWNCVTKYWDGSNWCEVICCVCPPGFIVDPVTKECTKTEIIPATPSGGLTAPVVAGANSTAYGAELSRLYENISAKIFPLNGYQNTSTCGACPNGYQVLDNAGGGTTTTISAISVAGNTVFGNSALNNIDGRLNAAGIWATGFPPNAWLKVQFCITIDVTKTYIFAIAGDNQIQAHITSSTFNGGVTDLNLVNLWGSASPTGTPTSAGYPNSFKIWHMFPITLPAGVHTLVLSGMDFGTPATFGAEIYDISEANMMTLMANPSLTTADLQPYIIFSTLDLVTTPPLVVGLPGQTVTWTCPEGYTLTGCFGVPSCVSKLTKPCNICIVYSETVIFDIDTFELSCRGSTLDTAYFTTISNITDLVTMLNSDLVSTIYGSYYDNGDGRVRLEILLSNPVLETCPCDQLSMRIYKR